jgi:fatty acid desaturase
MAMIEARADSQRIPGMLNAAMGVAVLAANGALLYAASHAPRWWGVALAACAFSYTNNTMYSLLHESVHRKFHPSPRVNEWFGRLLAASFPTGFTFHRMCHLGHHRRNRTEVERFDYYGPDDSRLLKFVQWYGILTGLYWIVPPLGCLVVLFVPRSTLKALVDARGSKVAEHIGMEAMLDGVDGAPAARMRVEILFSAAMQIAAWLTLDLSLTGWLACYAAFAVNWSALQYADHAWSELDVRDGAWNLKVNRVIQYVFLNYHHHLAHHQHPEIPWIHLDKFVDARAPRPSFLSIYLSMWKGPRPLPEEPQEAWPPNRV